MQNITKPTLLLDERRCRRNIEKMAAKARRHGLIFRPHFKTHQSLEVGRWFREAGVDRITVSSLDMATYFAQEWTNITVAFPVNILEINTINDLAATITLQLLVESEEAIAFLAERVMHPLSLFIKIDVGYGRTGIPSDDFSKIEALLRCINAAEQLRFSGFLAHAGHTYGCRGRAQVLDIHNQSLRKMAALKERYPDSFISIGDTPGCSLAEQFNGVDEIRPGNFVFYDLTQAQIGSNTIDEIAVALACPVVATHPARNELVIYGGGAHLSKDRLEDPPYGTIYGKIARPADGGWQGLISGMYVKKLSQEHGIVHVPDSEIDQHPVGSYLLVLPVHSCMTALAMRSYTFI